MDILSSILSQQISGKNTKETDFERIFWFTHLMKWIQHPRSQEEKINKAETVYTVRLKYLLLQLNNNPEWKAHFVSNISSLLLKISSGTHLTSAGLSDSASFIQELIYRVQEKILPQLPLSDDLETLIYEIFPSADESLYIDSIDPDVLAEILGLFAKDTQLIERLKSDVLVASFMLSRQILNDTLTIQKELLDTETSILNLSEFRLESSLRQYYLNHDIHVSESLVHDVEAIETHTQLLHQKMKDRGVKIELVYLFQIQKRKIHRLKILLQFLNNQGTSVKTFRMFVAQLILETHHQKSLRSFFAENLAMLTDRIVETSSHIGEHYVTFTWTEFRKMFESALGGGAITAVTVIIKHFIVNLNLTGFVKGLVDSLNYSSSFLVIQLLGWTLATKQPSSTAPFIAAALQKSTTESRKSIVALLRTQFIAVFGNLSMVFPICFLVSWLSLRFDYLSLTKEEATHMFNSTNILGPSPLFAVFTGVLLFLASLFAGWVENWTIVHRMDKRIKYNERIHKIIGRDRAHRLAHFIYEKANPLAANLGLGFLLGMSPQFIKFLGIPLEARHVTLSTGGFAASLPVMIEAGVSGLEVFNSVAGILVIGVLNLSVSFLLAFLLASISSKVKFSSFWRLLKWGLWLILTRPWLLFVPEKQTTQVEENI